MPKIIKLADIDAHDRLRPLDLDQVQFIAASIEDKGKGVKGEGLDTPFKVRPVDGGWKLVTGGHRHAALLALEWNDVEVGKHVIVDEQIDAFDAEIAEIDENLCRNELNPLDRALFIAKRRDLCAVRRQAHGGDRKSSKWKEEIKLTSCQLDLPPRFTKEVSEKVGMSERSIFRDLRIAQKLDPKAIEGLRGTPVERNQQQLLALCDCDVPTQRKVATSIAKGEAKSVAEARVAIGLDKAVKYDLQKDAIARAQWAWSQANALSRAIILDFQNAVPKKKGDA